jgi:hypothetical protein
MITIQFIDNRLRAVVPVQFIIDHLKIWFDSGQYVWGTVITIGRRNIPLQSVSGLCWWWGYVCVCVCIQGDSVGSTKFRPYCSASLVGPYSFDSDHYIKIDTWSLIAIFDASSYLVFDLIAQQSKKYPNSHRRRTSNCRKLLLLLFFIFPSDGREVSVPSKGNIRDLEKIRVKLI